MAQPNPSKLNPELNAQNIRPRRFGTLNPRAQISPERGNLKQIDR
jgi:hypothetical protein